MKTLKNYDNFSDEYMLNENLIKKAWDKIANYFIKKYKEVSWLYYMLFMKKTNQLEKMGVKLYVPYNVSGASVKEVEDETGEKIEESAKFKVIRMDEAFVNLKSDDPNMVDNDPDQLIQAIKDIVAENEDRVEHGEDRADYASTLFVWGAPGIGKTSIVKAVAKELDMVVEVLLLSTKSPEDFKGVPAIKNIKDSGDPRDERTVFIPPKFLPWDNCPNGKGGILFFDEMNQANKDVLGAAMTFCLDGTIEEYSLPDHWVIVAAGNREGDVGEGGNIVEFSKPLANRFSHVNFYTTKDKFISHVIDKKNMSSDVIQFLEFKPDALFQLDSDSPTNVFPTPRGWVLASNSDYKKRKRNWKNKLSDEQLMEIYGKAIGLVTAGQFVQFLKLRAQFDEKDVQNVYKTGKAKKLPTRADLSRAASVAIGLYKKGEKITPEELQNVYDYALTESNFETLTSILNYFNWVHPDVKTDPKLSKIYMDTIKKWFKRKESEPGDFELDR